MSKETHDQNQSVDTPDTAPSFMRVVMIGIGAYLLVACIAYIFLYGVSVDFTDPVTPPVLAAAVTPVVQTVTPNAMATQMSVSPFPPQAYWQGDRALLTPDQISQGNLQPASDIDAVEALFQNDVNMQVIFIDRAVLSRLSDEERSFLQTKHADGVMLVALQAPHSLLTEVLQLETGLEDIDPTALAGSQLLGSIHYSTESGPQELVQTFDTFTAMLNLVAALN